VREVRREVRVEEASTVNWIRGRVASVRERVDSTELVNARGSQDCAGKITDRSPRERCISGDIQFDCSVAIVTKRALCLPLKRISVIVRVKADDIRSSMYR